MPSGSRFALIALLAVVALGAGPLVAGAQSPHDADATAGPVASTAASATSGSLAPTSLASPDATALPAGPRQMADDIYVTNNTIEVQLQPDGNARVTIVVFRRNLTSEAERESFNEVATAFQTGGRELQTEDAVKRASEKASLATGRDMNIQDVTYDSSIFEREDGNATGELRLSLTWTNFAQASDGHLEVGDVFETSAGTWLPRLEPGQTLVVRPPEGYDPITGGSIRDGSFYWEGPRTFSDGDYPYAEFSGDPRSPLLMGLVVAGVAGVFVVVTLIAWWRGIIFGSDEDRDEGETPAAVATGDDESATQPPVEEQTNGEADEEVDVELLSDEERVERLLEQNGGRMKQANIVKETGWSNAKVSQLLSSMEDADRIDKLRIGRENLISFPDEDVADLEE